MEQLNLFPKLSQMDYVLIRGKLKGFIAYEAPGREDWYYVASSEGVELVHVNDLSVIDDPFDSEPSFHENTI